MTTAKMIASLLFRKLIFCTRLLIIGNRLDISFSLVWMALKVCLWLANASLASMAMLIWSSISLSECLTCSLSRNKTSIRLDGSDLLADELPLYNKS